MAHHHNENESLLLVDDNPTNLKLFEVLLEPLDVDVIKATNGKDALHLLNKIEVDLVILDIMMPEMDGLEVCYALKNNELTRMIPIILVTALNDSETKIQGINQEIHLLEGKIETRRLALEKNNEKLEIMKKKSLLDRLLKQ